MMIRDIEYIMGQGSCAGFASTMHSPESEKPSFRYRGRPASVASRLISVAPRRQASPISMETIR